jgi:hypothetical protein
VSAKSNKRQRRETIRSIVLAVSARIVAVHAVVESVRRTVEQAEARVTRFTVQAEARALRAEATELCARMQDEFKRAGRFSSPEMHRIKAEFRVRLQQLTKTDEQLVAVWNAISCRCPPRCGCRSWWPRRERRAARPIRHRQPLRWRLRGRLRRRVATSNLPRLACWRMSWSSLRHEARARLLRAQGG